MTHQFTSRKPLPGGKSITLTARMEGELVRFILFGKVYRMKYERFIRAYRKVTPLPN